MKTIEVTVGADGNLEVETKGYKGNECLKATEEIENAIGKRGRSRATPEAYQREQAAKVTQ